MRSYVYLKLLRVARKILKNSNETFQKLIMFAKIFYSFSLCLLFNLYNNKFERKIERMCTISAIFIGLG